MWWLAAFYAFDIAVIAILVARCPEGYEDERGFHYGKPEEEKVSSSCPPMTLAKQVYGALESMEPWE